MTVLAQQALPHSSSLNTSLLNSVLILLLPHTSHLYSLLAGLSGSLRPPASLQTAAPLAASALIAAAWQSAILVALVALALRLIPRLSATVRSLIWTAVLALAVLLPLLSFATPTHPAPIATTHATLHLAEGWSFALAAIWAAISLVKLIQLARSAAHLAGITSRAAEVDPTILNAITPGIAALLQQGRRPVTLCISAEVDRPSVAGFFSPRILLPVGLLERVTPLELEQILRHEREHLQRHDDWVNLAQKLALALFPLNPALWLIERRLCAERELACDDTVLRETRAAKAYALCLANLAEMSLARKSALLALAAWQKRSELARRVERILFAPTQTMSARPAAAAGALVTLLAVGSAATLAHAPALVSFVPSAPPNTALAANDLEVITPSRHHLATGLAAHTASATPVTASAGTRQRAHASNLVMTLPAQPQLVAARPTRAPRAFRAIDTMATAATTAVPAQAPQPTRQIATLHQLIATSDDPSDDPSEGTVTSWYVVTIDSPTAPTPAAQPASLNAAARNQAPLPSATQSQHAPRRPQPHYVPTYAAFPTPAGWLLVEL